MNKEDKKYIESLVGDINSKMPDYDGDGYPDLFDCDPFDPTKDGLVGDAWARMTGAATRARQAARRVYAPTAARARQSAAQATARVRSSAAAAQRRVASYRRSGVERAEAIRSRPVPKPRVDIVKTYRETEHRVSEKIPTLRDIEASGTEFGARPAVQKGYQDIGRQVLRLPEPIKAVGVETFKFSRGAYKEFQQYPVTTAAKTAAFYYAGPAIRGAGVAATSARAAIAARGPAVARIPGVGRAAVSTGEKAAWVGEKAAKYALPAMGALWAGSIGQRVYATPAEMRSEEAGRIFASEVVPMAGGAAIATGAPAIRPRILTAKDVSETGVETIAKQLFIGKKRMPIGYEKTVSQRLTPSPGKTQLAMESEYKAMVGQLKYTHTRFARGQIEGDYFLPTPPKTVTPLLGELGAERLMLPSPVPKPTRLYGEISQRYIKAREIELAGERQMSWLEVGKRKLEYGVPKPPKYDLPDIGTPPGTWGISGHAQLPRYGGGYRSYQADMYTPRPSSPMGLSTTEAETLSALTGVPRPKMIPERMYFQETPITSKYYEPTELLAAMRRPAPPVAAEPIISVPKPSPKPRLEPMLEHAPAPEPVRRPAEFAEPAAPHETPWAEPTMKRAPLVEPKRQPLPFAEPTLTRFEFPWAEPTVWVAPKSFPTVKPSPAPKRVTKMANVPIPYTAPYKFPDPMVYPSRSPTPTPRRRAYPVPSIHPYPSPAPSAKPAPRRRAYPAPDIYTFPDPVPSPEPTPMPRPGPSPVPKVVEVPKIIRRPKITKDPPPPPPPPPPPFIPFMMDGGIGGAKAVRGKGKRAWKQEHELIELEDVLGYKL